MSEPTANVARHAPRPAAPSAALRFKVRGMDCADEVAILRRELGPMVGGQERLAFDLLRARLTVSDPPAGVDEQRIARAVAGTGMRAEPWREASEGAAVVRSAEIETGRAARLESTKG